MIKQLQPFVLIQEKDLVLFEKTVNGLINAGYVMTGELVVKEDKMSFVYIMPMMLTQTARQAFGVDT